MERSIQDKDNKTVGWNRFTIRDIDDKNTIELNGKMVIKEETLLAVILSSFLLFLFLLLLLLLYQSFKKPCNQYP